MTLSLDQTIAKLKEEQLPCWKLFILNVYKGNTPELFASFKDKDLARSLEYLQKQVEFCTELQDCHFEIQAKASETSNGPDATKTWSFKVPAKGNRNLNGNLSGYHQPSQPQPFNGFGAVEHIYLGELQRIPHERQKLEDLREELRAERTTLTLDKRDLERDKQEFAKFLTEKRRKLRILRKKFQDNTEAGKAALGKFFNKVVKDWTGSDSDSSGMAGAPDAPTKEQKIIQSICSMIDEASLSVEEIKAVGITVNLKIKALKNGNGEASHETAKTKKAKKETASAE